MFCFRSVSSSYAVSPANIQKLCQTDKTVIQGITHYRANIATKKDRLSIEGLPITLIT